MAFKVVSTKFKMKMENRQNKVFNIHNAPESADKIYHNIRSPYVSSRISTLGGDDRVSILFTASLDRKEDWDGGILENSRYARFHLDNDGTLELFSGNTKGTFRKARTQSVDDAIRRVNTYLDDERMRK